MRSSMLPPPRTGRLFARRTPWSWMPASSFSLCLLLAGMWFAAVTETAGAATQLLRVTPASKAEFLRLQQSAPEVNTCGAVGVGDAIQFPAPEGRAAELKALGFTVDIDVADLETFYSMRLGRRIGFGAYHTYTEAIQDMDALAAAHPTIMSPRQSIGTTLEGRTIWVYKISDNPGVDEDEPEVFFNAYIHAREPITFEVVYDLAQYLVNGYGSVPRATTLVNSREIWILPVVNPDGVEYNYQTDPNGGGMWRKNRRLNWDGSYGIDLNRNFGYMWGYDENGSSSSPWSETYRGTDPFSEAETQAIRNFTNSRHFKSAVNYHSYGNLHLFAWGFDSFHIPDHEVQFGLGRMRRALNGYSTGATWEVLYATNGDANDWMYGDGSEHPSVYSFVSEVGSNGDGFWPAESRIPALKAENLEPNLRLIELADNPARVLPPAVSAISLPDTVPVTFTASWTVPSPDVDNPATAWNLMEATGYTVGIDNLEGANAARWSVDGWALSTARSHSATHSYYSGRLDSANGLLMSLRGHRVRPGEQLRFWTWYNIERNWDYGYVEISTNARDFTPIAGSITTTTNPNHTNLGNGVTGASNIWVQATFDISDYTGQVIWLRFRYNTDRNTTNEGWYVDDIEPADLFFTETVVASGLPSAQYQFNSHAEGLFAFLVQSVDADGDVAIWSAPEAVRVLNVPAGVETASQDLPWRGLELSGSNPFSGSTQLRYTIPSNSRVNDLFLLSVHDVSGRQVALLRQGVVGAGVSAGATLQDSWSPRDLSAGLYFARLTVGDRISEQRLVYLK